MNMSKLANDLDLYEFVRQRSHDLHSLGRIRKLTQKQCELWMVSAVKSYGKIFVRS